MLLLPAFKTCSALFHLCALPPRRLPSPAVMEPGLSRSSRNGCVATDLGPPAVASRVSPSSRGPSISPRQVYQQFPLAAEAIRVIELDGSADTTAPLSGSLRVIRLKDCPTFTALSYVWGRGGTGSICCNGCAFGITPNCQEALLSLRSIYGNVCIWVDAICINQDDDAEKDWQIPLMGEIYTWARVVYVWLGPGDDRCVRAVECLKMVSAMRPPRFGAPWVQGRWGQTVPGDRIACLAKGTCFALWKVLSLHFIPRELHPELDR